MHIGVKGWLRGKIIYWHFSTLKCLDLQPTYHYFCVPFFTGNSKFCYLLLELRLSNHGLPAEFETSSWR